tara:strand:- start:179 stop:1726 length:1548 start_codon:yes stop_codon:yes gene_type:complete
MEWMTAHPLWTVLGCLLCAAVLVVIYDVMQTRRAITHNYPLVGHLRFFLESIGPEIRQYFIAQDKEELPFSRDERRWIYTTSKNQNNTFGFGTNEQVYGIGYPVIKHSAFPVPESEVEHPGGDKSWCPSLKVIGEAHGRARPFRPRSILNVSAMSFGSLGYRAISSLNRGALEAGCYHNSGEGGVSPYHRLGADVVWQLGTGYFGARDAEGRFSIDRLAEQIESCPQVRAIEIKLSQGAKPGKGGILPGAKVTPEIAEIRGIPVGQDCISPNAHPEFRTTDELMDFIERVADRTGLPVGIKSAIGQIGFWEELADRMSARGEGPDFIAIDGAEGGTGAAPLTFADHVALPFKIGLQRVFPIFQQAGLDRSITWIGSGKLGFPDRAIVAMAMGCDLIQVAREAMLAIGCIQAQKCHTGHCPAGVATQNRWLQAGLNIDAKSKRLASYVRGFRKEMITLSLAAGYRHPGQFTGNDIEFSSGVNRFSTLSDLLDYSVAGASDEEVQKVLDAAKADVSD